MFNRNNLIALAVVVVLTIGLTLLAANWYTRATDKKKRAEFDAALAVSKQINDQLRKERDEQAKRGDEAAERAAKLETQVPGLQAELAKFGAAGAAAIKRQEEAAKQYEKDKTTIRNSTDACALCQWLCTEREKQSTADVDLRCPADYCQQYCRQ